MRWTGLWSARRSPANIEPTYGLTAHHPAHVQRVWSTIMPVLKTSVRAVEAMQDLHMLTRL
jgi:hypothetical protein